MVAAKDRPEPENDLQTGIVSGVVGPPASTGCLLAQSRRERIGFDCPRPEM
jgi:hypothetical protein